MAVISQAGYSLSAQRLIGTTPSVVTYMAVGSGSLTEATNFSNTTLQSECGGSGCTRVSITPGSATYSFTSDTVTFSNTWTATGAANISEAGLLNSSTGGTLFAYGTFSGPVSMVSGDTLQVTWSVSARPGSS
jgi:hypothetical protein